MHSQTLVDAFASLKAANKIIKWFFSVDSTMKKCCKLFNDAF